MAGYGKANLERLGFQAKTCLAHQREFGNIMAIAAGVAFEEWVMRMGVDLRGYANDSTDWAELFFKAISTNDMINNLVMSTLYECPPGSGRVSVC